MGSSAVSGSTEVTQGSVAVMDGFDWGSSSQVGGWTVVGSSQPCCSGTCSGSGSGGGAESCVGGGAETGAGGGGDGAEGAGGGGAVGFSTGLDGKRFRVSGVMQYLGKGGQATERFEPTIALTLRESLPEGGQMGRAGRRREETRGRLRLCLCPRLRRRMRRMRWWMQSQFVRRRFPNGRLRRPRRRPRKWWEPSRKMCLWWWRRRGGPRGWWRGCGQVGCRDGHHVLDHERHGRGRLWLHGHLWRRGSRLCPLLRGGRGSGQEGRRGACPFCE